MTKVTIELDEKLEKKLRYDFSFGDTRWFTTPHAVAQLVRDALPDEPEVGDVVTMNDGTTHCSGETLLYADDDVYFTRRDTQTMGLNHTYWDRPYWKAAAE